MLTGRLAVLHSYLLPFLSSYITVVSSEHSLNAPSPCLPFEIKSYKAQIDANDVRVRDVQRKIII